GLFIGPWGIYLKAFLHPRPYLTDFSPRPHAFFTIRRCDVESKDHFPNAAGMDLSDCKSLLAGDS
ncbi:MAG: hypothetical protein WDM96_03635, partial [Lacunisphaera sp.]